MALIAFTAILLTLQAVPCKTEREHEKLIGTVKGLTIDTAKLTRNSGKLKEGRRDQDRTVVYDRQGNKTKETIYTDSPTITFISCRYDAQGNRTDSVVVDNETGSRITRQGGRTGDDRSTSVTAHIFACDADGSRIEEKVTRIGRALIGGGLVQINRHSYDAKRNRISTTSLSDGIVTYRWTFTNDKSGNPVKMTKYTRDNYPLVTESYVYEFDAVGNWIKRYSFKEKGSTELEREPLQVTYRKIDYF